MKKITIMMLIILTYKSIFGQDKPISIRKVPLKKLCTIEQYGIFSIINQEEFIKWKKENNFSKKNIDEECYSCNKKNGENFFWFSQPKNRKDKNLTYNETYTFISDGKTDAYKSATISVGPNEVLIFKKGPYGFYDGFDKNIGWTIFVDIKK